MAVSEPYRIVVENYRTGTVGVSVEEFHEQMWQVAAYVQGPRSAFLNPVQWLMDWADELVGEPWDEELVFRVRKDFGL